MSGIFDRLNTQIEQSGDGGISPLDLAKLPDNLRKIMRLMVREVEMSEEELVEAIKGWPKDEHMDSDAISDALKLLVKDGWLIKMGEQNITYRANLRRKAGSQLRFWSALDDRISSTQPDNTENDPDETEQG